MPLFAAMLLLLAWVLVVLDEDMKSGAHSFLHPNV
jgi:hypothetical protein